MHAFGAFMQASTSLPVQGLIDPPGRPPFAARSQTSRPRHETRPDVKKTKAPQKLVREEKKKSHTAGSFRQTQTTRYAP